MSGTLLEQWRDVAYDQKAGAQNLQKFWDKYFEIEKGIYEQLLTNPDEEVKGTVKELAEKYGQDVMTMVGFLDGINESLKVENPIETMEEDTEVRSCIRTWSRPRRTGSITFPSGIPFIQKRNAKSSIRSRSYREQSARRRRLGGTTRVPAVPGRNIRNAVENRIDKEKSRVIIFGMKIVEHVDETSRLGKE